MHGTLCLTPIRGNLVHALEDPSSSGYTCIGCTRGAWSGTCCACRGACRGACCGACRTRGTAAGTRLRIAPFCGDLVYTAAGSVSVRWPVGYVSRDEHQGLGPFSGGVL
mmetsp:Transcript_17388/g.21384  ORF Transcript_17388/g.21384 Transcript_17388/m.21384 type:complete len:109 (+) Transcript_17388:590-916(+)